MDEQELKLCPFCGGEEVSIFGDDSQCVVSCECGAMGPTATNVVGAVEMWNRRTEDTGGENATPTTVAEND